MQMETSTVFLPVTLLTPFNACLNTCSGEFPSYSTDGFTGPAYNIWFIHT